MRRPHPKPWMIDVGLAVRHEGGAVKVRPTGMRGFQPPEMLAEGWVDPRSDVWVLGRALYALGAGILPRKEWDDAEFARRCAAIPFRDTILAMPLEARRQPFAIRDVGVARPLHFTR